MDILLKWTPWTLKTATSIKLLQTNKQKKKKKKKPKHGSWIFSFVSVKVLRAPLNRIVDDCKKFHTVTLFGEFQCLRQRF